MDRITIDQADDAVIDLATEGSDPLPDLAACINAEHQAAQACFKKGTQNAIEAGRALLQAKDLVPYGQWGDWQKKNLKFSVSTAGLYMRLARLPDKESQRVANLALRQAAKIVTKEKRGSRTLAAGDGSLPPPELRLGDFRKVLSDIEPNSVDLIIADLPYKKALVPLYGDVAEFAARVLTPGGSFLSYLGKPDKPGIYAQLSRHLNYRGEIVCHNGHGPCDLLRDSDVLSAYRSIAWFDKPPRRRLDRPIRDFIERDKPEKEWDTWQQPLPEAIHLIDKLSAPGDLIVDPVAGSGTSILACRALQRRVIAAEIDEQAFATASRRLASEEEIARANALVTEMLERSDDQSDLSSTPENELNGKEMLNA